MRRNDREIFGEEIEAILRKGEYGILSTVGPDGKPYAVPLSYAWKNGKIHLHCAANVGKKLENLAFCPDVCFVVVGDTAVQPATFSTLYESVILTGKMVPSQDPQTSLAALVEKYSPAFGEQGMRYIQAEHSRTGVYVIVPESITGKAKRGEAGGDRPTRTSRPE